MKIVITIIILATLITIVKLVIAILIIILTVYMYICIYIHIMYLTRPFSDKKTKLVYSNGPSQMHLSWLSQ